MKASPQRFEKLRRVMQDQELDTTVIVPGSNFRYLTASVHFLMERPLLLFAPKNGQSVVVIPALEYEHFASHGFDAKPIRWTDQEGYDQAIAAAVAELHLDGKRIGVEGQLMRYFESLAIQRHAPNAKIIDAHQAISSIRLQKDAEELATQRRAVEISEQALGRTLEEIKVGMTERDIMNILLAHMSALGAEGFPFEPLVLAGENSARPHGKVRDDYAIQTGDALLFDFGATYHGYHADITRTVFVGEASDEQRAIYAAVKKANETGHMTAKPGTTAGKVDEQAAQAMRDAGYSDYILHRTGHGLGLDVHEAPFIVKGNDQLLAPGMVFTIEPGLYVSGTVGVRIEDNVVVTEDGCESMSTFTR
ncbi:MAG: aminopeptidase P family protein, partial [Anaerolineae bacterium]|nr:aminopeptidase P family protein [Anaerolineae bacterium]